jgi:hypothetical protein
MSGGMVSFEERDCFIYPKRTGWDSEDGSAVVRVLQKGEKGLNGRRLIRETYIW